MSELRLPGDVIIYKLQGVGTSEPYTVGIDEKPQTVWHAYSDAHVHAERYAQELKVDAWYSENPKRYSLLARLRAP